MKDRAVSQRISPSSRLAPRPTISRKRSNSVPVFGHVYVSQEEASVLVNAAERATARRQRRPASVDTPGPAVYNSYDADSLPSKPFNFSTPSRYGVGASSLRDTARSTASSVKYSARRSESPVSSEDEDEKTPTDVSKPLPPPPQDTPANRPVVVVRPPSALSLPPSPPFSPRRQVANETLKAYADGLFSFTQNRLKTAAPQNLRALGLAQDIDEEETPPPTPELEQEQNGNDDVAEMRRRPSLLRSKFSDWSSTTADTDTDDGYPSSPPSPEPRTPDGETDLISPDSFFSVESTPRVVQRSQWATLSSARPSSGVNAWSMDSPTQISSTSSAEPFSYFAGFDSVTTAGETRFSETMSSVEAMQPPQYNMTSHSQPPTSSATSTPYYRHDSLTPLEEPLSLSRPPSWLIKAIS